MKTEPAYVWTHLRSRPGSVYIGDTGEVTNVQDGRMPLAVKFVNGVGLIRWGQPRSDNGGIESIHREPPR